MWRVWPANRHTWHWKAAGRACIAAVIAVIIIVVVIIIIDINSELAGFRRGTVLFAMFLRVNTETEFCRERHRFIIE